MAEKFDLEKLSQILDYDHYGRLKLNLAGRRLVEIPPCVYDLEDLEVMTLSWTDLKIISDEISKLVNLSVLQIWKCSLKGFPEAICKLAVLRELDLSFNDLGSIPRGIEQLTHLTILNMCSCHLTEFPVGLCSVASLRNLDLSQNALKQVPSSVKHLTRLSQLCLQDCGFQSFPEAICEMPSLMELDLSGNTVREVPNSITNLSQLTVLWLYKCGFLTFPEIVCELPRLEKLDLSQNSMRTTPWGLAKLSRLSELQLWQCGLEEFPASIQFLRNLTHLNVGNNEIKVLPHFCLDLPLRCSLFYKGNPIEDPPPEVCDEGEESILSYLHTQRQNNTIKVTRKRMVLVGETEAGKTCLLKSLVSGTQLLSSDEECTHVVDHYMWQPDNSVEIPVTDIGGLSLYRVTRHFFLSSHAVILLVVNLETYCESDFMRVIGTWLSELQTCVPGATVILVGTHSDQCSQEMIGDKVHTIMTEVEELRRDELLVMQAQLRKTEDQLKQLNFPKNMKEHEKVLSAFLEKQHTLLQHMHGRQLDIANKMFVTSAHSLQGVEDLKHEIIQTVKSHGFNLHHECLDLYKTLLNFDNMTEYCYLTTDMLEKMETAVSVSLFTHLRSMVRKDKRLDGTLDYLDKVDVLWLKPHPQLKHIIFHRQQILTDLLKPIFHPEVAAILDYQDPSFKNCFTETQFAKVRSDFITQGLMAKELLQCLWDDFDFDDDTFETMTQLLVKLGLCCEVLTTKDGRPATLKQLLYFPSLQREVDVPAKLVDYWPKLVGKDEQQLTIEIHFPFSQPDLFFMKAAVWLQRYVHHHTVNRLDWQNGVYTSINRCRVLMQKLRRRKVSVVSLSVRGGDIQELWAVLLPIYQDFKRLLQTQPGSRYSMYLLCAHCIKEGATQPHQFLEAVLERPCPRGLSHVPCPNAGKGGKVPVSLVYPVPGE